MDAETFFNKVETIKMPVRIVILLGTVVLLGVLFIWLIYMPKSEEIKKTKATIASLQQKLNRAKVRSRSLKKFEMEFAQVDAQFQEALRLLPNEKEIPNLLKTITKLGTDSKLEFRLFRPQKERVRDFYIEIPVSIEVSGNYHDVAIFFDRVGRMERIVNILNVSMKPVKGLSTNLVTKCNAVTYSFRGPSNASNNNKKKKK
jgi:type IV pilus assembly protein PilO